MSKALSFTNELSFFLFINTPRSAAVQWMAIGHQMYSGDSVIGKGSTIDPEISHTVPIISQGGDAKSAKFAVVFNITQL